LEQAQGSVIYFQIGEKQAELKMFNHKGEEVLKTNLSVLLPFSPLRLDLFRNIAFFSGFLREKK
jgi:hypothetical protein